MDYRQVAAAAARRHGIDPSVFIRQIGAESGFDPTAKSPAGALGIAQIMPATARGWRVNPLDPVAALDAAAKNMAGYLRAYGGRWEDALEAYNAGPGAVIKGPGVKYAETRGYVKKILGGGDVVAAPTSSVPAPVSTGAPSGSFGPGRMSLDPQTVRRLVAWQDESRRAALDGRRSAMPSDLRARLLAARAAASAPAAVPAPAAEVGGVAGGAAPAAATAPVPGDYGWLEAFAREFGLRVNSTYRDPEHNRRVGGSPTSAHMRRGAAGDLVGSPAALRRAAEAARQRGFREVFYDPWGQYDNGAYRPRGIGGHVDHLHVTR